MWNCSLSFFLSCEYFCPHTRRHNQPSFEPAGMKRLLVLWHHQTLLLLERDDSFQLHRSSSQTPHFNAKHRDRNGQHERRRGFHRLCWLRQSMTKKEVFPQKENDPVGERAVQKEILRCGRSRYNATPKKPFAETNHRWTGDRIVWDNQTVLTHNKTSRGIEKGVTKKKPNVSSWRNRGYIFFPPEEIGIPLKVFPFPPCLLSKSLSNRSLLALPFPLFANFPHFPVIVSLLSATWSLAFYSYASSFGKCFTYPTWVFFLGIAPSSLSLLDTGCILPGYNNTSLSSRGSSTALDLDLRLTRPAIKNNCDFHGQQPFQIWSSSSLQPSPRPPPPPHNHYSHHHHRHLDSNCPP